MICPICNEQLKTTKDNKTHDAALVKDSKYFCYANIDDHFYGIHNQNDKIIALKIRIKDFDDCLVLKIDYNLDESKAWRSSSNPKKISIPHSPQLDFSDLDKIKQKIKTYLIFG